MRKLLQSPIAVAIMGLVAAFVVLDSIGMSPLDWFGGSGGGSGAVSQADAGQQERSAAANTASEEETESDSEESEEAAEESDEGESGGIMGWFSSDRDPFRSDEPEEEERAVPAEQLLHLEATWLQTQSSLAILNDQIVSEGAPIQGITEDGDIRDYVVREIEANAVWVEGPEGRERVGFRAPGSAAGPNGSEDEEQ